MRLRNYLVLLLLIVLAAGLLWFLSANRGAEETVPEQYLPETLELPTEPLEILAPESDAVIELPETGQDADQKNEQELGQEEEVPAPTEPEEVLPELNDSDAYVRNSALALIPGDDNTTLWARWLAREELIRRFSVVVENAARGELPKRQLGFLAPGGKFKVLKRSGALYLDPQNYIRFEPFVDAVMVVPIEPVAKLLTVLEPLLAEAFQELGARPASSKNFLTQAIEEALATPIVHGDIKLEQPKVFYTYADRNLEALSPLQKQILRMGPSNILRIQTYLRKLKLALKGDVL